MISVSLKGLSTTESEILKKRVIFAEYMRAYIQLMVFYNKTSGLK